MALPLMDTRVREKGSRHFDAQIPLDVVLRLFEMHHHLLEVYHCHVWDRTAQKFCRFYMNAGYCRINIELKPLLAVRVNLVVDDVSFPSFVQYLKTKMSAEIKDDRHFHVESQGPVQ